MFERTKEKTTAPDRKSPCYKQAPAGLGGLAVRLREAVRTDGWALVAVWASS